MRSKTVGKLVYIIFALLILTLVYVVFVLKFQNIPRATLEGMVYGQAYKPFVYRTLAPTFVRIITALIPVGLYDSVRQFAAQDAFIQRIFPVLRWNPAYIVEYAIALILSFGLLVAFLFTVRGLIQTVFNSTPRFTALTSLATVFGLVFFMGTQYSSYIYDLPTLVLFTFGLRLIAQERWRPYFVIFLLACINKETAILLTLIYAIHLRLRWRSRAFWGALVVQGAAYGLIKGALTIIFNSNPGTTVEFTLDHNLDLLASMSLATPLILIGLALFTVYRWKEKPTFLKEALWMLPPLFLFGVFFGYLDEIRIFYEVYPVIALMIAYSAARLFHAHINARINMRGQPDQSPRHASDRA